MSRSIEKRKLTPPEVAALWGVTPDKIVGFIRSGELKAINGAAAGRYRRPRYLIDVEDLANFEQRREVQPAPKQPPRRPRRERSGDDYY
jgi:hypothetical protein